MRAWIGLALSGLLVFSGCDDGTNADLSETGSTPAPTASERAEPPDETPLACRGAVVGEPCDDSFLPFPAPDSPYPLRFACESSTAHDPGCRPRLTCVDRIWQRDDVYPTGPDSPACEVFPPCALKPGGGLCEGAKGGLCLRLNDVLHCDQTEVFHGPIVLFVPQAGAACTEEGKAIYDCGMGGGDRRCVGGIWVLGDGLCY